MINEDTDFYHQVDFNEEDDLEYEIPNSELMYFPEDNMVILPVAMRNVCGMDNYKWNHYKLPTGEIYEFPNTKLFIKRF